MGLFKARYRLCFLHKIDFGFHAQGFVGAGKLKEMGKVLVKEIADIHKWFCRECETSAEEDSGRAKLARRLKSERYQQICRKDLCKAMLDWSCPLPRNDGGNLYGQPCNWPTGELLLHMD